MSRAWLAGHRRAAQHRDPAVDPAVFLGAQFDVRDAQIEGLRDALAQALKERDEERSARSREVAHLRYALAQAVQRAGLEYYVQQGRQVARRLAEEPTHHVPQPAPGWRGAQTEQYRRPQ